MTDKETPLEKEERFKKEAFTNGAYFVLFAVAGFVAAYIGGMDFFGSVMFMFVATGVTVFSAVKLHEFLWRKGLDDRAASLVAWGYGLVAVLVLLPIFFNHGDVTFTFSSPSDRPAQHGGF